MLYVKSKLERILIAMVYLHSYTVDAIRNNTYQNIIKREIKNNNLPLDYFCRREINKLIPIKNTILAIYFRDNDGKKSALFVEYDKKTDFYVIHYAKRLYTSKQNKSNQFSFKAEHYINLCEKDILSIFGNISADIENVYRVCFLNKLPNYVPAVTPRYADINELSEIDKKAYDAFKFNAEHLLKINSAKRPPRKSRVYRVNPASFIPNNF